MIKQKAALAITQSSSPFNMFSNDIWQSLLHDLMMKTGALSKAARNKLIKDLGNERQVASTVKNIATVLKKVR